MLFMDHNASDALVTQPQNLSRQPYVLTSSSYAPDAPQP
jgi:hypothetical protein